MKIVDAEAIENIFNQRSHELKGLYGDIGGAMSGAVKLIQSLSTHHIKNQTHLCNSCIYFYPECPSEDEDVIYGNGIGNDNICACAKYAPLTERL